MVFVFLFVDFFDTTGTVLALGRATGIHTDSAELPRARGTFLADALATPVGALLGASTTTAYIESAAGVREGGRTGLVALLVGGMFLLSLLAWPVLSVVPAVATAPVLVLVGLSMLSGLRELDPEDRPAWISAGLTAMVMPLTYSIANGVSIGILSWTLLSVFAGRRARVDPVMAVLSLLLVARYAWLAVG